MAPVMTHMSGDPASICAPKAAPHSKARPTLGERRAPSAARTTHGIHAAPARWCHTLTMESSGPERVQIAAPTNAADRESSMRRASRNAPLPARIRWATT
jgi:hypothetical protein